LCFAIPSSLSDWEEDFHLQAVEHARHTDGLRYASNLTELEWQLIAPHLPSAKPLGRRRKTDLRRVVEAMLYLLTTDCQ